MSTCVVAGINWGDEGKGRMVDLLTQDYDVVVRYQGGGNAGHTVINDKGKFALHLLPSGLFRDGVMNILGNGVAVDFESLAQEISQVTEQGVSITPDNFMISERASLLLPWHKDLDGLEEARLADKAYGSTKQGIAPFYSDKFQKKTILAGELFYPDYLKKHLETICEWKNLTLTKVYDSKPYSVEEILKWLDAFGKNLKPFIGNTQKYLQNADKEGKKILFETQLGSLRDLDFGIVPYTTSSNPIASYAPVGSGYTDAKIERILGVVKAYSTCVGEGPFTCEWFGKEADELREHGFEYGAKTGRPRRVGPLDLVATRYGVQVQGVTEIALTKLDILDYLDEIPVCTQYLVDGKKSNEFPFPCALDDSKPVYEYLPGWKCDISKCRKWEDLPKEAQKYVEFIEENVGCKITYVSVGPKRDEFIKR